MRFEKISFDAWKDFFNKNDYSSWSEEELREMYDNIKLPKAGSSYAAGHDFYCPFNVTIGPNYNVLLPTGIRWVSEDDGLDTCLLLMPRSGLGTKFGMRLLNTIGVVDADYYWAANEGHIMACVTSEKEMELFAGDRFMQGIIIPYFRCGEQVKIIRDGGFGSTGVK